MKTASVLVSLVLAAAMPAAAQQPGDVYRDKTSGRKVQVVAVDSARVYYVALDTVGILKSSFTRAYALVPAAPDSTPADTTSPPPPPPPPPVVIDSTVRIYASHDFNDGSLGPFTGLNSTTGICSGPGGQCSSDVWARNGRAEIRYERLNTNTAGDRNRGIKWVPKNGTENTPFGATLYVAATWTIPSVTPSARAAIDSAAAAQGLPVQSDTMQEQIQRKLLYGNPGRKNHWVLKVHGFNLQFMPYPGGAGCTPNGQPTPAPITVHRFKDHELFDKPQRIEIEVKRASGVRVPDGEVKVWLNSVQVAHRTGFCTNEDLTTGWQVQIGQQMSYTAKVGELYSEIRAVDDVVIANKRPH